MEFQEDLKINANKKKITFKLFKVLRYTWARGFLNAFRCEQHPTRAILVSCPFHTSFHIIPFPFPTFLCPLHPAMLYLIFFNPYVCFFRIFPHATSPVFSSVSSVRQPRSVLLQPTLAGQYHSWRAPYVYPGGQPFKYQAWSFCLPQIAVLSAEINT